SWLTNSPPPFHQIIFLALDHKQARLTTPRCPASDHFARVHSSHAHSADWLIAYPQESYPIDFAKQKEIPEPDVRFLQAGAMPNAAGLICRIAIQRCNDLLYTAYII